MTIGIIDLLKKVNIAHADAEALFIVSFDQLLYVLVGTSPVAEPRKGIRARLLPEHLVIFDQLALQMLGILAVHIANGCNAAKSRQDIDKLEKRQL